MKSLFDFKAVAALATVLLFISCNVYDLRVEVPAEHAGVQLIGNGVELDPHFLSQNVTGSDGATELDWRRTVVKRCRNIGVERYRVMLLPNWWESFNDDDNIDIEIDMPVGCTAELQADGRETTGLKPGHNKVRI